MLAVLRAFEAVGLDYVLIGATAMGFHGVVRATEDVDLLIRATPEYVERRRAAFRAAYSDDPNVWARHLLLPSAIRFTPSVIRLGWKGHSHRE